MESNRKYPDPAGIGAESAVSEVVGEMLMIALVIVLISVFATTLSSFIPAERAPAATIRLTNETPDTITLWHQGGDWIKASNLRIIVANSTDHPAEIVFRPGDAEHRVFLVPQKTTFDLGSNITIAWGAPLEGNETVKLATQKAVIFSGQLGRKET